MENIRPARREDLGRIAEIMIFCYRLNFYPIFRDDEFYFRDLRVENLMRDESLLDGAYVYDDGVVKGFVRVDGCEIKKLFVEPVLQGNGIGEALLMYAMDAHRVNALWALEKNTRAIAFYRRHGFEPTGEKIPEEDTDEYLVRLRIVL